MPYISCAPPRETLNPVITSSKISSDLFSEVFFLKSFRKDLLPGTNPIFPAIGSTITAARSFLTLLKTFKNSFSLLNSQLKVFFASSFGIPGESGKPNVLTPEPALMRRESTCP